MSEKKPFNSMSEFYGGTDPSIKAGASREFPYNNPEGHNQFSGGSGGGKESGGKTKEYDPKKGPSAKEKMENAVKMHGSAVKDTAGYKKLEKQQAKLEKNAKDIKTMIAKNMAANKAMSPAQKEKAMAKDKAKALKQFSPAKGGSLY